MSYTADELDQWRETERCAVETWRLDCLLRMGYNLRTAERHAAGTIDLHELERLLQQGCAPVTALEILC